MAAPIRNREPEVTLRIGELTSRQEAVLRFLEGAKRASRKAIRSATGAGPNTLVALRSRELIAKSGTQFRLTDKGAQLAWRGWI